MQVQIMDGRAGLGVTDRSTGVVDFEPVWKVIEQLGNGCPRESESSDARSPLRGVGDEC